MALIQCPECGKEVSDKARKCPHCGYPLEDIDFEKEEVAEETPIETVGDHISKEVVEEKIVKEKKAIPKKVIIGIISGVVVASLVGYFATSNIRAYNKGKELYSQKKYKEAIEKFSDLDDYKDSKKLLEKSKKMYAIQTDKTNPKIEGLESGSVIEVQCGTQFNLNEYLKDKISISDDVTVDLKEYYTECDEKVYDSISGKVDTCYSGEFPVKLSAKDEAGNEGSLDFVLKLNPVHVTKENPHPVVYDGEYGTITIKDFKHGDIYGKSQYYVEFEITNNTEESMLVYLSSDTFINDYQVGAYYTITDIAAGKKGTMESHIYEEDIPDDIGNYSIIESNVGIAKNVEEGGYYNIPIIFDVNVSQ